MIYLLFGGSDAHKENCVGLAGTYLPDYIHSEDDLINYINDGNHPEVGGKRYPKTLKDKIGPAGKFLTYGFSFIQYIWRIPKLSCEMSRITLRHRQN